MSLTKTYVINLAKKKKKKKLRDHIISDHDFMTTYINFKKKILKKIKLWKKKRAGMCVYTFRLMHGMESLE